VMREAGGSAIRANADYTFRECVNMYFQPVSAGTFTMPYVLTHNGNKLEGTLEITIRAASLSATISRNSLRLSPYSNQSLYVTVTPLNSYFSVSWRTGNADIVSVSGNGCNATLKTSGKTGTTTVGAVITDRNGVEIYQSCTVTVAERDSDSSSNYCSYSPSISMAVGSLYTGTGVTDSIRSQFKDFFGTALQDSATVRFSSTGNNKIATMRLRNGRAISAYTNYTMGECTNMYIDAASAGRFTLPYTLTYRGYTMSGNLVVNIGSASIVSTITLNSTAPYTFASASADGSAGSGILGSAITNSTGSKWSHIRFGVSTSGTGALFRDTSHTALGDRNVTQSDLANLYFVPSGFGGEYSIPYTVYNYSGSSIANGMLYIRSGSFGTSSKVSFGDVKDSDWFGMPVQWAVGRGITNGMGKNKAGQDTFQPNTTCNKAQIITFLWRSQGSPAPTISNPFNDVKTSDYFYNAAVWAYERGLASGASFGEKADCTRAMAVTYMWKLAGRPSVQASSF
ncbi:MAG: S-layer homology domain-containing protein, partial [Synergistaceae bacterium]|nr:S-layer homology domain-containing protein [Synergistaceae bacterium]